jgi:hypothetical protein
MNGEFPPTPDFYGAQRMIGDAQEGDDLLGYNAQHTSLYAIACYALEKGFNSAKR